MFVGCGVFLYKAILMMYLRHKGDTSKWNDPERKKLLDSLLFYIGLTLLMGGFMLMAFSIPRLD